MYKKILLPTDGSAYADQEIKRACDLIADDGEILVISVAGKLTSSAFQRRAKVKKLNARMKKEAEAAVKNMVDKFDDKYNVTPVVKTGFAAETIIKVAEDEGVDLIIIASSGKSGIHRFILGSVTEQVLKMSEMDVLLVHED